MNPSRKALIVFMRYPEAGKVKSRLAAGIGWEKAAWIYEKLARRTLGLAADLKRVCSEIEIFLFFTPPDRRNAIEVRYPGPWRLVPQEGSHLGDRMAHAFDCVFANGYCQALMVGCDIADLQLADFKEAFQALEQGNAVLNPAADGGFYLIGLNRQCPLAFEPEDWGTPDVFRRTLQFMVRENLDVRSFEQRFDIDRPEDLTHLNDNPFFTDRLSVIIPTLSSPEQIRPLIDHLHAQLWPEDEIIVVRGSKPPEINISRWPAPCRGTAVGEQWGSNAPEARPLVDLDQGAPRVLTRCVTSPAGRGNQLNRGAKEAGGDIFWFLHDDGRPPDQFAYHIRKISIAPGVSLGCFELGFSPPTPLMDWIARWANFRTRRFKLPYGDQGFFCRREIFEKMGGFLNPFLMEDLDFAARSSRAGDLMLVPEKLFTSPQRYISKGILRRSLQNHLLVLLYFLGMDNRKLYSLYYR